MNSITPKLWEARSRLYRCQILQVNSRWKPLAEIYKIYTLSHRSAFKMSPKIRQTLRQVISNDYLLAKVGFDTAENEPLKVCQKLAKS